ncbi:hypothetical protein ACFWTE_04360 [Nocardiopsis sp. NPDC058631]|uniref:TPR repeat region-containing protein n=1 Tax=Nocardiopsis sp. NPDC058631 TaxID=3346566 RepID=UPI003666AC01
MASFQLFFSPRSIESFESQIRPVSEDLVTLEARLLGRADDLEGGFDSAATHFTDIVGWDITTLGSENYQQWVDAAVNLRFAIDVNDMWADFVKEFWDKRDAMWDDWDEAVASKVSQVPSEYQGTVITAQSPTPDHWFDSDARKCRELYDELSGYLEGVKERERDNWDAHEENALEILGMLRGGPTSENVQKLIDGGYANMAYANLDPEKYLSMESDFELTPESAEEAASELAPYWSGDKPLDDRYHELMLVMSMIGTNARNAQNDGTELRDEEVDFLEAFYTQLEMEGGGPYTGVLSVPGWMEGDHMTGEEREHALGTLGDGLLALSDPELGGGYESLPESVRRAAEGPFLTMDPNEPVYALVTYTDDVGALTELLRHTDEDLQGGYTLSTNLTMSAGSYNYFWGSAGEEGYVMSEDVSVLADVGTRNEDANYYVLTGEQPSQAPETGPDYPDKFRQDAVQGLLTYEWHDQGEAASGLIDWISEGSLSEDEDVRNMAGEAASGFIGMVTTPEMQQALTDTGVDVGDSEDASFTEFNPALADRFADVFDSYLFSFAASEIYPSGGTDLLTGVTDYNPETRAFNIGVQERAAYMQYLMGDDDTAARVLNSAAAYERAEIELYLGTGDTYQTAPGAASLYSLIDLGLEMEVEDRTGDLESAQERKEQLYTFALAEGGDLAKKLPVVGAAINKGLDLGADAIVQQLVDTDIEITPKVPRNASEETRNIDQQAEFLNFVVSSESESILNGPDRAHLDVLEEYGALTYEDDGSVTIETDSTKWDVTDEPGGGRSEVADALHGALNSTQIDPSNREQNHGNYFYNEFSTPYENRYTLIQDVGRREEEK